MTGWSTALLAALVLLWPVYRSVGWHRRRVVAARDGTCGLVAPARWMALAARELTSTGCRGSRVGVLMLNLDHRRQLTSRHGAGGADVVTRAVGAVVRAQTRGRDDVVCRLGDDRLLALLPGVSADDLQRIAHRIRRGVVELTVVLPTAHEPVNGFSVSIGAAVYPQDGRNPRRAAADGRRAAARRPARRRRGAVRPPGSTRSVPCTGA